MSCRNTEPGLVNHHRGVVLITVLIIIAIITLIATQVSSTLIMQQRRSANILQTDQAFQFVLGAESLAAAELQLALKGDEGRVHLGQAWVGPHTFPIEGGLLRGEIIDMSTCFNVNALFVKASKKTDPNKLQPKPGTPPPAATGAGTGANPVPVVMNAAGQPLSNGEQILLKLYQSVIVDTQVSPDMLVATLRDWIDSDAEPFGPDGAEDYEYMGHKRPYRTGNTALGAISELRTIKGYTPKIYEKLRPYLCALPDRTYNHINVNTLPVDRAELLVPLITNMTPEAARAVLQGRPKDGWTEQTFWITPGMPHEAKESPIASGSIKFTTQYFLVKAEAFVGRGKARVESLLKASSDKTFTVASRAFAEE